MGKDLKAPFPYFGGKSRIASVVWDKLGDVDNYIEPFFGSGAVLLLRPTPPRIETVNDADCYVTNFWRATATCPELVAEWADSPVNEADVHSRHRWLVLSPYAAEFRRRMRTEPGYFDARIAGWWCWGLCCWIGSGWCGIGANWDQLPKPTSNSAGGDGVHAKANKRPALSGGDGVHAKANKRPALSGDNPGSAGHGVHSSYLVNGETAALSQQVPDLGSNKGSRFARGVHDSHDGHRPQLADAYARGRGVHGNDDAGTCAQRRAWLIDWFQRLRDRLRTVRVCCGDWSRVCSSESVLTRLGTTGVFLDPPYSAEAGRDDALYAVESGTVAHDVRRWCLEHGPNPDMRIILCGYVGEGHEELEALGWEVVAWKTQGGYGNRSQVGNVNAKKERLWCSPGCLKAKDLFSEPDA